MIAELEAARDAKYREIRDAELDLRTGKLSDEDYERDRPDAARRGDRDHARARGQPRAARGRQRLSGARPLPSRAWSAILDLVQVFICVG